MDNDFDWACRRLAKLFAVPLFPWLLTDFADHLLFLGWEDTRSASLPGVPQGIRDTIARLKETSTGRLWVMLLEFQLQPDPEMFGRLLIYLGASWLELRPDDLPGSRYHLAAAVLNLTGTRSSLPASCDMVLPGRDGVRCTLTVRERYLQEEAALDLLRAIQAGQHGRILLPFIPLLQTDDVKEVIRLWLELWAGETDERLRGEYVVLARVFLEAAKHRERWRQALEGLNMQRSAFLEEIRNQTRTETRKEALLEGQAQTIVRQLQLKFPGQLSAELATAIEQTRDQALLDRWMSSVLTAASLDEFRRDCGL